MPRRHRLGPLTLAMLWIVSGTLVAQDAPGPTAGPKPEAKPKVKAKAKARPVRRARSDGPGTYMGRVIAPVMSFEGGA
ncbi:hypothetical protein ACYOEI_31515, partial [Singulisphaera rosea]